jgi:hypothetical protein
MVGKKTELMHQKGFTGDLDERLRHRFRDLTESGSKASGE